MTTPTQAEIDELIVKAILQKGYDHWLKHGTPIKPEDAPLVMLDIAALQSLKREDGMVSVPVEPTMAMIRNGAYSGGKVKGNCSATQASEIYKAMIAAREK